MRNFNGADAMRLAFVEAAGFVPGGRQIYCCVLRDVEGRQIRELRLFDRSGGGVRVVTGRFENPRSPQPSPDGTRLAFAADFRGVTQVWVTDVHGTDCAALTSLPQGVTGTPRWSPDGREIAVAVRARCRRDPSLPYRVTRPTFRYEGIGYVEDALQDIHVADVKTGLTRRLTDDGSILEEPRWSPDGREILFLASFPPGDVEWAAKPSAQVVDVNSGERREVVGDWGGVFEAEWSAGGSRIVFYGTPAVPGTPDVYQQRHDLYVVDAAGGTPACLTDDLVEGAGSWLVCDQPTWARRASPRLDAANGTVYANGQRGGDILIHRAALSGDTKVETIVHDENRVCLLADVEPGTGALLYTASTLTAPPELYLREASAERRLTRFNDEVMADVESPQVHRFDVTAPDGLRLDGWALTPPRDGPFPAVLAIHGGPCSAYGNTFMIDHHLLTGTGIAVVFSNFRGSGGYGTEFMRAIGGKWGEIGERDHHATIDTAVDLGIADPQRLGVYGLSHGGFATCWLLGRSDRFRAGVSENPVTNFVSQYGTMDAPWWIGPALGARPDEDPALYAEISPLTYARNCTTPLLFIVGEADLRCPMSEAEQYYRVLKTNGVTTEMLRLPGSDHVGSWTGSAPVRAAQNEALVEWFARHLLGDGAGSDGTDPVEGRR